MSDQTTSKDFGAVYQSDIHRASMLIARHQITNRNHRPDFAPDHLDIQIEERAAPSFYDLAREILAPQYSDPTNIGADVAYWMEIAGNYRQQLGDATAKIEDLESRLDDHRHG